MAYTQSGSHFNYFAPDAAAPVIEIDVGAASADAGELVCVKACQVNRLMFAVTGEAIGGTTTAPTVVFTKRPTPNSATGESVVGTLTLPDTTAIGKVVYKDLSTPIQFDVGDVMEISHTVGVGTPTGIGIAAFECEDSNEVPANNSDMVASA